MKVGERRSFTRAELRPGATVKCTYRGHSLALPAPTGKLQANGATWPGFAEAELLPERDREAGRRVQGDVRARRVRARDL